MELRPISGLILRRAMFAVLLEARRPVTVGEVVNALRSAGVTTWTTTKPMHKIIADMLAYQARAGRVLRTGRATYAVIPRALSRSTQRRCRRWRELLS
jgi:hypothetical protein